MIIHYIPSHSIECITRADYVKRKTARTVLKLFLEWYSFLSPHFRRMIGWIHNSFLCQLRWRIGCWVMICVNSLEILPAGCSFPTPSLRISCSWSARTNHGVAYQLTPLIFFSAFYLLPSDKLESNFCVHLFGISIHDLCILCRLGTYVLYNITLYPH